MTLSVPGLLPELSQTLHKILHLAHALFAFDRGAIHLLQDGALVTEAVWAGPGIEVDAASRGRRLRLDEGFCAHVLHSGQPFLSPDISAETRLRPANYQGSNQQIHAFLGVPLLWEGQALGVLEMDSHAPGFFQPSQLELAEVVAAQAALTIHSARAAESQRQLRAHYQHLLDSVEPLIFTTDAAGRIRDLNASWSRFAPAFGLPVAPVEPLDRPLEALFPPLLARRLRPLHRAVLAGLPRRTDEWIQPTPQGARTFRVEATPLAPHGGKAEGVTFILSDLTDRRTLEGQLQSRQRALLGSRDQLAALLDATESAILMSDSTGRVVHVNEALCTLFGLPAAQLVGQAVLTVVERVAPRFDAPATFVQRTLALHGTPTLVGRDSLATVEPPRLFQRYSAPLYDRATDQPTPAGRIEVYSDVTESRHLEGQLQQYLEELLSVQRASVAMGNQRDPAQLFPLVCERACSLLEADGSAVLLLGDEPPQLHIASHCGVPGEPPSQLPLHDSLVGQSILQRQPLLFGAHSPSSERDKLGQRWSANEALVTPLESRGRVLGGLLVLRRDGRPFDAHAVQLLQIFAAQAAVTLENSNLLREAQARQQELAALSDYTTLLIESSPVGIAAVNPQGRFVRANPTFQRLLTDGEGRSLLGERVERAIPALEESGLFTLIRDALHGTPRRDENFRYHHPTNGERWLEVALTPQSGRDGEVMGAMLTLTDITERKRLEADLRQRNERINRQLGQHRVLYDLGTQLNAELEVQRVLEALMASVRALFDTDGLSMLMPTATAGPFEFVSALGLSEGYLSAEQAHHGAAAPGLAIAQRAPMFISDVAADERMAPLREAALAEGLHSALFLPLLYREEVVGLMALYHRRTRRYTLEEMELLAIFVSQATTAIKNAQFYSSIAQSRSNLNAILESMTDGVVALDEQDQVIFINQTLFDMLDLPRDAVWVGRPAAALWPLLADLIALVPAEQLPARGEAVPMDVSLTEPTRTLEVVHAPILDEGGERQGRLVLIHDITQLRANERLKDELISTISHELRTPLTSILGYSKLLVDRPNADEQKRSRWAAHIVDKSRLLADLMDEVLDLSHLATQQFQVERLPTDLALLLRQVVQQYEGRAPAHRLLLEAPAQWPMALDERRMGQALGNLLANAIKYSPDGGDIHLTLHPDDEGVLITLADQGIGIAPEYHDAIFEPFFRVDNSTTRAIYGTGLGLPLVRGIVEAHGGTIALQSAPGEGTMISLWLPAG